MFRMSSVIFPLDLFLVAKFLLQNITISDIHCITWSDHAPVSLTVGGGGVETRANRWQNYSYLMNHPENKLKIAQHIKDFFTLNGHSVSNPTTLWNTHKAYM